MGKSVADRRPPRALSHAKYAIRKSSSTQLVERRPLRPSLHNYLSSNLRNGALSVFEQGPRFYTLARTGNTTIGTPSHCNLR